jgi:catechol 2,3-dioxygenase-like lactoylglutathione lyase family enzyme
LQRLGHLSFDVTDIDRTREFFDALLGELGFRRKFTMEHAVCYSSSQLDIWFAKEPISRTTRGKPSTDKDVIAEHIATLVSDREKVKAVETAMLSKGFTPLFPAQECPQFEEGYFSVCFNGPDNIVIEIYTNPKELTA